MKTLSYIKKAILAAACIALCVVLPMAFHSIPNAGGIYLPMHIPVLLCGLICGAPFGLLCGLAGPLLSSLLTGMPAAPMLPGMLVELAAYGLLTGLMMRLIRTRFLGLDLYLSLITALLGGRLLSGVCKALLFARGSYSLRAWVTGSFILSWPGLVIQLILIPALYLALERSRLIPSRKSAKRG